MRSRYTAYVMQLGDYLMASWAPETRPQKNEIAFDDKTRWLGLEIRGVSSVDKETATVEFVARYKLNGRAFRLHETSRFKKQQQHWRYVDGVIHDH